MTDMTIYAVFRSRSQSLDFAERLRAYGVPAETQPTPKEAGIGCGLCVCFDSRVFHAAKAVLRLGRYSAFKGFFKMDYVGGRRMMFPVT